MTRDALLRDAFASVVGIALAVASIWLLRDGLIDWKVTSGGVLVGLYLALPRRMRIIWDALSSYLPGHTHNGPDDPTHQ